MLAYVEKRGEGGCDRGMGPRSDSMATTQQNVCVYDEQSKHSNQSGVLHVERGSPMDGRHAREERKRRCSSALHRTHAVFTVQILCVGYLHAACRSGLKKGRAFYRLIHARAVGTDGMDRRQLETWSAIQTLRW